MSKLVRSLILLFVPLLLCNPSASRAELVRLSISRINAIPLPNLD